jgi:hypothetical protein
VRRLAIAALLLVPVAACRGPGGFAALPAGDPRPGRLLAAWEDAAAARHALRGRARLEVRGGGVDYSARQVVVAERPARLRVEVLGLFGQAVAVLTTDGGRFELFRGEDLSFEEGELRPDILWQEARLALRPEEAIAVLLGAPLREPGLVTLRAAGADDGSVQVSLGAQDGALRRRLAFDAQGRLTGLEVFGDEGDLAWRATWSGFAAVGGVPFAHAIALWVTEGDTRAAITLRDVELNPELPPGIFSVRPAQMAGAGGGG